MMFGTNHENLVAGLEAVRARLCGYIGERCDCKFGASGVGEQTGCPEVRQAIAYLNGEHESVIVWERLQEASAQRALKAIRIALEEAIGAEESA